MAGAVKLKDIADALGVSTVTVSNALSGKRGVSDSVREEIVRTAREFGYDFSKYEKKKEESVRIGVLVSEKYLEIGNSFYWSMYQKVVYAASKKNSFTILEILKRDTNGKSELPKLFQEGTIDGLIIIGWLERQYLKRVLAAVKVPVLLLDFCLEGSGCDAVMSNNYVGMYKATRYLLERGHREVAFLGAIEDNNNIMDRYFGYRKAMEEWGLPIREDWVLDDRDIVSGAMKIELPRQLPTAFACSSDLAASYLYDKLKEEGYRVPEDISLTAYDNCLFGHSLADRLTTYNVDMEQMANAAIHVLLKKIKKQGKRVGIRYIDGELIERESVGYVKQTVK